MVHPAPWIDLVGMIADPLPCLKQDTKLLCVLDNDNGLPQKEDQPKERLLQKFISEYEVDLMGWVEVNLHIFVTCFFII